ncbi:segregation and condensation protein A [Sansalvadorimonas verongulae]|uniref:segregation and condensation protein A n=1 Tax=Sansalvadorimonas verongulae TaxID=2172824 RepID=UPI0012BCBA30|nr:ScpA family protein [Sansalvadorimonas verongulae]MTI13001.1 segregation/condensation protein A [Sansalvadorimonas verongulae]
MGKDNQNDVAVEDTSDAGSPEQLPLAIVGGEPLSKLPDDLYIPPDALEVFLEAFEGPLDLLLYLIKRNNMDILNIEVASITRQYMEYVELMESSQFELAAEYLVMAATLAEIKSRMLLPRQVEAEDEEEDPRAELIRRLQEYERFKQAAEDIDAMPRMGREIHKVKIDPPKLEHGTVHPDINLREVLVALGEVMKRAEMFEEHHIQAEVLSTRERMSMVLEKLRGDTFVPFVTLFTIEEGRLGVVVTFLAVMELIKESLVELVQTESYGPIHVKARVE